MPMLEVFEKQLAAIKEIFPGEISNVVVHNNGDDFVVLEINSAWIFRFPRRGISRDALKVEKVFLAKFTHISPLPVPDYQFFGEDFVGYPKIQGASLSLDLFQSLSKQSQHQIARQIGGFLSAVHNFPVEDARQMGVTEGWNGWHQKGIQTFREELAPMLTPTARRNALACLDRMLAEPFESKVVHGDFALEDHVFFDAQRQELSGVIDFADVTLNDPAHDFQNIVEYGGEEFFDEVMKDYHGVEDPTLLKRTRLRIEARPLFEASYSLIFGFEERFKERMNWIESNYGRS
jgi:aminoglycoside 2''-phosphotransferase